MICPKCNGYGGERATEYSCHICKGSGQVEDETGKRIAHGIELRRQREKQGVRLNEMAERLGISVVALCDIEFGRVDNLAVEYEF